MKDLEKGKVQELNEEELLDVNGGVMAQTNRPNEGKIGFGVTTEASDEKNIFTK